MAGKVPDELFRPEDAAPEARLPDAQPPEELQISTEVYSTDTNDLEDTDKSISSVNALNKHSKIVSSTISSPMRGILVIIVVVVPIVALVLFGRWFLSTPDARVPSDLPSLVPGLDKPYNGQVKYIFPTAVEASCNSGGTKKTTQVSASKPELVLDEYLDTAWECPGTGVGAKLIFTFPKNTKIVGVSMTNGYTKRDTQTGDLLYNQYRLIKKVEWTIPNGSWFDQNLVRTMTRQEVRIPETDVSGKVTLTILDSTPPSISDDKSKDAVFISDVRFLTAE